eukprot:TRINITY_DN7955_c0_g1_i3.p1 TRINITY_DN7955_c0_g1~~TRINITY_DN7955_c0_g1_i3.p1  ORF type:complete len:172 (-),score=22.41 TRINITY_DN7955_c0_g1_i3:14-529(-)
MDLDRKTSALKQLQGHLWKFGYQNGSLKSQVYDDVIESFKKWKAAHVPIFIYSSGSILAQKLLFQHSNHGDLLSYLEGYYDTTIGSKVEKASYAAIHTSIAQQLSLKDSLKIDSILFVTDNILEANAANEAGMSVVLSVRPGNKELPKNEFPEIRSFGEIENYYNLSSNHD